MSVKVIISRLLPNGENGELDALLALMRALAVTKDGHISGEALARTDKKSEHVVISQWGSLRSWKSWVKDEQRRVLQARIDELIGGKTTYVVYRNC